MKPIGLMVLSLVWIGCSELTKDGLTPDATVDDNVGVDLGNTDTSAGETNPQSANDALIDTDRNRNSVDGGMVSDANVSHDLGTDSSTAMDCVDDTCGMNAVCFDDANGPRCECVARFVGDGNVCTPQPCPDHASGAPECTCDDEFEGDLDYDDDTRS